MRFIKKEQHRNTGFKGSFLRVLFFCFSGTPLVLQAKMEAEAKAAAAAKEAPVEVFLRGASLGIPTNSPSLISLSFYSLHSFL